MPLFFGGTSSKTRMPAPTQAEKDAAARLYGVFGSLGDLSGQMGQFGGDFASALKSLLGEMRGLPTALDISQYIQGTAPDLVRRGRELSSPIIQQARGQLRDFMSEFEGGQGVSAAVGGTAGSSVGMGRRLMGREIGLRNLENVITSTNAQFNPLALGQQIGSVLQAQKMQNIGALGNMFQIGTQLFGQRGNIMATMGDIVAQDVGQLRQLRGASASTKTKQWQLL